MPEILLDPRLLYEKVRERTWPWLPMAILAAIGAAVMLYIGAHSERTERAECQRLYSAAHSLTDTLLVDAQVPFGEHRGVERCGTWRQIAPSRGAR